MQNFTIDIRRIDVSKIIDNKGYYKNLLEGEKGYVYIRENYKLCTNFNVEYIADRTHAVKRAEVTLGMLYKDTDVDDIYEFSIFLNIIFEENIPYDYSKMILTVDGEAETDAVKRAIMEDFQYEQRVFNVCDSFIASIKKYKKNPIYKEMDEQYRFPNFKLIDISSVYINHFHPKDNEVGYYSNDIEDTIAYNLTMIHKKDIKSANDILFTVRKVNVNGGINTFSLEGLEFIKTKGSPNKEQYKISLDLEFEIEGGKSIDINKFYENFIKFKYGDQIIKKVKEICLNTSKIRNMLEMYEG